MKAQPDVTGTSYDADVFFIRDDISEGRAADFRTVKIEDVTAEITNARGVFETAET